MHEVKNPKEVGKRGFGYSIPRFDRIDTL